MKGQNIIKFMNWKHDLRLKQKCSNKIMQNKIGCAIQVKMQRKMHIYEAQNAE